MKKYLLAFAAAFIAMSASALSLTGSNKTQLHPELRPDLKAVEITSAIKAENILKTRAEQPEEIYYTLAGLPQEGLSFQDQKKGMQLAMAFQIDPAFIDALTDGEITGISFYTGVEDGGNVNNIRTATVFIANALDGTYLYEQEVECPATPFSPVYAELNEPFKIPTDTKVYVGVYFTLTSPNNVPVVVDSSAHVNTLGGWVGILSNTSPTWSWENIADYYGFLTLGATIRATSMPKNSVSLLAIDGQPISYQNEPLSFQFLLQNNGVNVINTLTVEYGIEGETPISQELSLEEPLELNQHLIAGVMDFVATQPTKKSDINVTITRIDGVENTASDRTASYPVTIVAEDKGLPRNIVIEEFTSTSCVYCPVGYTAMEKIREEYTDGSIIPVCIHVNSPGRDPMTATTYNNVFNNYCKEGVPSAVINRAYDIYPVYDNLIEMATQLRALPGIASVTAEASIKEGTRELTIDTKTKFAFDYADGDQNFILAYGITENDLGPYTQQNGYAGADIEVSGDWQNKPKTVELIYNDVARQLDKYSGIAGSIPAEIVAGEEYSYSHTLNLVRGVKDLDNINIVVYLINRTTREIENACMLKATGDGSFSGINDVTYDEETADAPVEYYNLQGIRVANPSNGLYIVRQGKKVSKTYIR
ncbi:MAG: hypothetical protein K2H60_07290 [Muribaculaceae bacterium]|nr:hypothetical protein [Muribaculaceae bacterium]